MQNTIRMIIFTKPYVIFHLIVNIYGAYENLLKNHMMSAGGTLSDPKSAQCSRDFLFILSFYLYWDHYIIVEKTFLKHSLVITTK